MALTSTLYTGLSGLNTNQTRMNVVGNNIANVNTVAFKASRALFKPQFYVTDAAGGPPTADAGGQNPSQRGLGAVVASIEKDFSQGSIQPTGKTTDLAIDGDGFFVVNNADGQRFTRDGSFDLDANHNLVTNSGAYVQGYGVDASGNVIKGKLQDINIPIGAQVSAQATSKIPVEGILNATGDVATGASIYDTQTLQASGGGTISNATLLTDVEAASAPGTPLFSTTPGSNTLTLTSAKPWGSQPTATFTVTPTSTVGDLMTFMNQSMGIDTSVSPAPTPAPGATVNGAGNGITITGNQGAQNAITLSGNALAGSGLTFSADPASNASGESIHTPLMAYDSLGTAVTIDVTAVLESKTSAGTNWRFFATSKDNAGGNLVLGNGTLSFDNNGLMVNSTGTQITLDRNGSGATANQQITLDFSGIRSVNATSTLTEGEYDGNAPGALSSFTVGADGSIVGSYTNGMNKTLGEVAMAKFNNPQGLSDEGGNLYAAGANSGLAIIGTPSTLGLGQIRQSSLEMSNVDLSNEFINLIVASTGFTAASRVITTSDQLLTDLLNTSR